MEVPKFQLGPIYHKFVIPEILCINFSKEECYEWLWQLSKSARHYLKTNHMYLKNAVAPEEITVKDFIITNPELRKIYFSNYINRYPNIAVRVDSEEEFKLIEEYSKRCDNVKIHKLLINDYNS